MIQSVWAIVLLLFWGTFEDVITYVVFMDWIFINTLVERPLHAWAGLIFTAIGVAVFYCFKRFR